MNMKLICVLGAVLALLLVIFLMSPQDKRYNIPVSTGPSVAYKVVVIDGCQYIEVKEGVTADRVYCIVHKGDCNNPLHSRPALTNSTGNGGWQ